MSVFKLAPLPLAVALLTSCGGSQPSTTTTSGASKPPASVAAAPSATASASGTSAAKPEPTNSQKLNIAYVAPSTLFLWEWVGLKQGLFEKNGIQVNEPVLVTGTPRLAQAVLANNFEVAGTGLEPAVTAAANGTQLEAIASLQSILGFSVVVSSDSPIREVAQLRGKSVGVSQIGNSADSFLSAVMAGAGASRSDVNVVQTGSTSGAMTSVLGKQLDAAVVGPTDAILGRDKGARTLVDERTVKVPNPQGPVVVTKAWADSHRPQVLAMLKTILQANALYRSNRDTGIKLQQDSGWFKDLPVQALGQIWDEDMKTQVEVPLVDDQAVREMIKTVQGTDPSLENVTPAMVYDNSFLNELIDNGFVKSVFPDFKR